MFAVLSKWFHHRRRKRSAVEAAVRHFGAATGKQARSGISGVIGEREGNLVVRVCYGNTKPPGRAWYLIAPDGAIAGELSFEEAQGFGERRWK